MKVWFCFLLLNVPAVLLSIRYIELIDSQSSQLSGFDRPPRPNASEKWAQADQVPSEYFATPPASLITIKTPSDVDARRRKLISLIWGRDRLPSEIQPTEVKRNIEAPFLRQLRDLVDHCDELRIQMEYGFDSHVFLVFPKNPNDKFILVHGGHSSNARAVSEGVRMFLRHGYTVGLAFMPTIGPNSTPLVETDDFGPLSMNSHNAIAYLKPKNGRAIKVFLEPVLATVNYVTKMHHYEKIAMTGLGGGGWTTVMYAALDPRIIASFPVGGANPFFLRTEDEAADYEQSSLEVYHDLDYMDLFLMGSHGKGRVQLRVYNKINACCFQGEKSAIVQEALVDALRKMGKNGRSVLFFDRTHMTHKISTRAAREILAAMP